MSTFPCPRFWEVEAARDGRLQGAALSGFERHAARCAPCTREQRRLQALARALREDGSLHDDVSLRRNRQEILDRAAALVRTRSEGRFDLRRAVIAAAITASAAGMVAVAYRHSSPWPERSAVLAATPVGSAKWTRHRERNLERVDLGDGVLSLVVRRSSGDPRVVVRVPEGEIEDLGTAFRVTVRNGRTVAISVSQGAVVFHRRGLADLRLAAGATWSADGEAREVSGARQEPPTPSAPGPAPLPTSARRAKSAARRIDTPIPIAPSPAVEADAVDEDAAYLQLLALLREGRNDEARLAAATYLRKFPTGFRRPEVERIARPTAAR
jgi:hypothetical protein